MKSNEVKNASGCRRRMKNTPPRVICPDVAATNSAWTVVWWSAQCWIVQNSFISFKQKQYQQEWYSRIDSITKSIVSDISNRNSKNENRDSFDDEL